MKTITEIIHDLRKISKYLEKERGCDNPDNCKNCNNCPICDIDNIIDDMDTLRIELKEII